jgi:hypothetical protein
MAVLGCMAVTVKGTRCRNRVWKKCPDNKNCYIHRETKLIQVNTKFSYENTNYIFIKKYKEGNLEFYSIFQ